MDQQTTTEHAPEASVEDRIGQLFAERVAKAPGKAPAEPQEAPSEPVTASEPQEAPEEAASEASTVEEVFELEVEGEKYALPKKLEKGFMQERDYTQKSQALAEQRRAVELIQQEQQLAKLQEEFRTSTQNEQQQLQALEYVLSQPVDWNALSADEAFRAKMKLDGWREQKAALEKAIGEKRRDWESKQTEAYRKLVHDSLETIGKRIPGWGPSLAKQVTDHALSEGYTDHELRRANIDPRLAVTLWKAQQYDALKAKATPTPSTAKVVKATSTNPMPPQVKDKLNFRKAMQKAKPGSPEARKLVEARAAKVFG